MKLDYLDVQVMEMALRYAIKAVKKEMILCERTKAETQEELLTKRLRKFEDLLAKLLIENKKDEV